MLDCVLFLGIIGLAVGLTLLMVRGVKGMWRDKRGSGTFTSGLSGAFSELDRVVRPSIEHVVEAQKSVQKPSDEIDGE
jgi:hypothetical protein